MSAAALFELPRALGTSRDDYRRSLYRDPCSFCGRRVRRRLRTLDHIQPLHDRGQDSPENWTACCLGCNDEKGGETLLRYLLSRLPVESGLLLYLLEREHESPLPVARAPGRA